jgi:hypothetical protein
MTPQGEPLRKTYETVRHPWRAGELVINKQGDKEIARYYWSTGDEEKLQIAILTLLASQRDFVIRIVGPAFTEKGCLDHDSCLELREIAYGAAGSDKGWEIVYNGKIMDRTADLEAALGSFLQIRNEKEIGSYFADLNFAGHAGPSMYDKDGKRRKVVIKEPEYPDFELLQWVWNRDALGVVVAKGDWPGWYRIWFGGGEIKHMPSCGLTLADPPTEGCHHVKPGDFPGWAAQKRTKEKPDEQAGKESDS